MGRLLQIGALAGGAQVLNSKDQPISGLYGPGSVDHVWSGSLVNAAKEAIKNVT
jgi:hypothetical protein